jgi:hypothetical protein
MAKIFSKKLLLLFSAIAFIAYGLIWACGGGDWDEYSFSSFAPEGFVDSSYTPFCFSETAYYGRDYDNSHTTRFNETIVNEWSDYLGNSFSKKEIQFLLLDARKSLVDSIQNLPQSSLPIAVASMHIVQAKSKPKIASFFTFLGYAKANEVYAAQFVDYWNYDDDRSHKYVLNNDQLAVLKSMETEFNNCSDLFVKQRYFFQILRARFFGAHYKACIDYYEKNKNIFPSNILAARCLSYVAGCYYKQKKYAQANYLYSKIYDMSDDFKTVAHFSFHPQNESDWKQTLTLCKNKEEQITLWHLIGIYFDEQRAIKEIYALDPKSEKLDLLLSRLVNLEERRWNNEYYYGLNLKGHLDTLTLPANKLIADIANEANTSKPYWWYLSAGYMHFLKADYLHANNFYDKAKLVLPHDKLAIAQHRLLVFLNRLALAPKLDNKTEEYLLPDLQWLKNIDAHAIPHFRSEYAYGWARNLMAKKYAVQRNFLKSELFKHHDSFYASSAHVSSMKTFLQNKQQYTPFEAYCASIYPIGLESIIEFQAIQLAYQDKVDLAIVLMKEAGDAKDRQLLGNPFNGNIKDCHDCDHVAPQKVKYTKLNFLQKLKELEANVVAGNDVYNNALLLGNAFYNMSHFGNARVFYEGHIMGFGHSSPHMITDCFRSQLLDCSLAKKYYRLSLSLASTDEQKVKLTYLLLKIERNEYYVTMFNNPDYNQWDYADRPPTNFSVLKFYKDTKYYADIIKECGYFRSYLSNSK